MSPGTPADRSTAAITLRRAGPPDAPVLAALRYRFRTVDYPGDGTFEGAAAFVVRCRPWIERP